MLMFVFMLALNFGISYANSVSVGRMWSESKAIGGSFRVFAVAGYVMAIAGFTMVYGGILLLLAPHIIPMIPALYWIPVYELTALTGDLLFVLIIAFIIPSGFVIWFNSFVHFWRRKTLVNGFVLGWNTFAQIRNVTLAARALPSAFSRITEGLFGKNRRRSNGKNSFVATLAILIVLIALLGGYFTASSIVKKYDFSHDGFAGIVPPEPA